MSRTNVYIDGFNLFYGALKGSPYKWLNLEALCSRLLPKDNVHRIRYFTARVSARPDGPQLPVRQQAYLRALAASRFPRQVTARPGRKITKPAGW